MELLHNNCFFYGNHAVCGTRGWFLEEEQKPHNAKVLNRELLRLETSLKAAGEKPIFCFLHYPPLYQGYQCPEILSLLEAYKVELCCYGHLVSGEESVKGGLLGATAAKFAPLEQFTTLELLQKYPIKG